MPMPLMERINNNCLFIYDKPCLKGSSSEKQIIFVIKDLKNGQYLYSGQAAKCSRIAPPGHGLDARSGQEHAEVEHKHVEAEHKHVEAEHKHIEAEHKQAEVEHQYNEAGHRLDTLGVVFVLHLCVFVLHLCVFLPRHYVFLP